MGDAFCLKWNNHQTTLVSVFDKLFECESLVDCTLAAEGKQLKAHKVVLSACSPYLEELIKTHEDKHPIIIFNSISYDELKAILEYMYRGEVNVSQEQLDSFLKVAESLKIKGLTDQGGGDIRSEKEEEKMPKKKRRRASSESSDEKEQIRSETKSEPVEESNSEPIEDLTIEEEDDDFGPPGPGTSQGSFSSQDFNNWQVTGDITNDEVFMAAQQDISNQQGNNPQVPGVGFFRPFVCTVCGKSYLRRKHLSRHMNQECGLNRGRYHCPLCPKNYSRKEHLFRHNLFKHSGLQIHKGSPVVRPVKIRPNTSSKSTNIKPKLEDFLQCNLANEIVNSS